ncbi:MAG: hypothetical protein AABY83_02915 [Pseudomonadota bacterium]
MVRRGDHLEWVASSPFLPAFSFYEIHESGVINAQPEEIIAAVSALNMRDDLVADVLLSIRELPSKLMRKFRTAQQQQQEQMATFGFETFTLLQRTSHELSLGLVGRFWRPDLNISHISNASAFELFDDPRAAKLVLRFLVVEHQPGIRTLRTETFVYCGDTRTRMLFAPYWLAIRCASGWIRRRTLASIQRQLSTGVR